MYLSELNISNFRAIKKASIYFQKGVNIIIGENNSGKSAIIDALRIGLGYAKHDNNIYIKETDFHINRNDPSEVNKEIRFDFTFEIENEVIEKQCFFDFLSQDPENPDIQTIQFHLKFSLEQSGKKRYFKRAVWGGDNEGQPIPYEALQEIFYIYLDPLRDALYALRPYSQGNKIGNLFNELTKYEKNNVDVPLDDEKKNELARALYNVFTGTDSDWRHILKTGNAKVNEHLKGTGISEKYPNIEMNYVGRKYSDVVKGIELRRPAFDTSEEIEQKYFELFQNGLGENNLIYASVVLGDLINRCEDPELQIYNALLVEEPEAHLHPQYQNTFFSYLNELHARGVQIFITSHSPTITAKNGIENLIVLQKQDEAIKPFCFSALSAEDFSDDNRKHLRKFLDVSKSQMFFANGVILVEGIAEAILIYVLSKTFLGIDLEKKGIEIININGVAFEHFAKLYNNSNRTKRLLARCAIITDSDPQNGIPKTPRALKAEGFERANLKVKLASYSFEHDLFEKSEKNRAVIRVVYRKMHPQTPDLLEEFDASTFWAKLGQFKDKGDFALELQSILETKNEAEFDVPDYIKQAIHWVTKVKENVQQAD